jgi:RNA-directed DNA polymerase
MWAKGSAVGNAARYPRTSPVRRRSRGIVEPRTFDVVMEPVLRVVMAGMSWGLSPLLVTHRPHVHGHPGAKRPCVTPAWQRKTGRCCWGMPSQACRSTTLPPRSRVWSRRLPSKETRRVEGRGGPGGNSRETGQGRVAHRIADPRILELIKMWLEAGVLESNELHETERGTPQGSGISPLLPNIFLHYVLDLWVHQWRGRHARGRVIVVRYADDFVMGFERGADAERMLRDVQARLKQFGLELHEEKTRLIEFGRLPALKRAKLGLPRPRTFAFLGFTHYCGWTRDGRFIVKHKTQSKRITRKLNELRRDAWRRMHDPLADQHRWYVSVLRGHCAYYGMPHNWRALAGFRQQLRRIWLTCLKRRSQRSRRAGWDWFEAVTARHPLPPVRITRSWAEQRLCRV